MNEQQLRNKAEKFIPADDDNKMTLYGVRNVRELCVQFASEVAAGVKNNCIETLWVHYKETGGYTNTASRFIQKITGEKWERDKEYDEMKQRIAELQSQVEALKQNSKARITELEDELKEIKSDLLK